MSLLAHNDSGEFKFHLLLISLFGTVLIPPYFVGHPLFNLVWKLVFSLVLLAAVYSVVGQRRTLWFALLLMVPTLFTLWLELFQDRNRLVFYLDNFTTIAFLGFICYQFFLHILRTRRVTGNIIIAAMCLYLMLGLMWAAIYANINLYYEGAFRFPDTDVLAHAGQHNQAMGVFSYFSFVTLSTLGYGDIVPVHKVAQSWVVVEAMVGQFYIAILMARLVGLHLMPGDK